MYKLWMCLLLGTIFFTPHIASAQENAEANCGVNSSIALSRLNRLIVTQNDVNQLNTIYPATTVSMLDVKQMCKKLGLSVTGVKSTFDELLSTATPCIINLKDPGHFLVLLDGDAKMARVIDGDNGSLEVIPQSEIESRFTGYALITDNTESPNAPALHMLRYDEYQTFEGINQKAVFDFPLQNTGKSPLSVEIAGTSCGCTAAVVKGSDPKKLMLAPGKSSDILVNYNVHGEGLQQQSVTLKTNDLRHPVVYLTIRGELPPQLTLSPPAFYVEQPKGKEPHKVLKVIGPKGTAIKRVWSDLEYLQFHVEDAQSDNERVIIPIEVNGFSQAAVGAISGKIEIELQNNQKMSLQVRGIIE
jgi:hypothetical protein